MSSEDIFLFLQQLVGRTGAKTFRPPNMGRPGSMEPGQVQAPAAGPSTSALAAAPPEQQKIMLGERLYPLVQRLQPEKAAKITGMLLEMDNQEVLYLIDNADALGSKVEEAVSVSAGCNFNQAHAQLSSCKSVAE